jgi:hypothetical protein
MLCIMKKSIIDIHGIHVKTCTKNYLKIYYVMMATLMI